MACRYRMATMVARSAAVQGLVAILTHKNPPMAYGTDDA